MPKKRARTSEQPTVISAGKILFGGIAGILFTVMLTFLASLAISNEWIPLSFCDWLGPIILAISAFLACLIATGKNGKKLISGMLCAGILGALLLICGLLLFSTPMRPAKMILSLGALVLGTIAGVVFSGLRQ